MNNIAQEFITVENTPETPIPSIPDRIALANDVAALEAQNDVLRLRIKMAQAPDFREYVMLMRDEAEEWGFGDLTAEQTINVALWNRHFMETVEAGREALECPEMCASFLEFVEGRARASVAESRAPATILAFRLRKPRS
jgi:hypothetical protein